MKDKIIQILKENSKNPVSGEKLSEYLKVSRTAIWKHINQLRQEGYEIESLPSRGYLLKNTPDVLSSIEIQSGLKTHILGNKIIHFDSIDSTNEKAKEYALQGEKEGLVITAEEQTKGKGRKGRDWISSKGSGIWMSILLRPDIAPCQAPKFTLLAAVAVAKSIQEETGSLVHIKWPNDIILNKKKVCGILTEMNAELDRINYIVVGIGINVNQQENDFSEEIKNKAISLFEVKKSKISRQNLTRRILTNLEKYYLNFVKKEDFSSILKEWKELSCNLEKEVKVVLNGKEIQGIAKDITEDGALLIENREGKLIEICYGDVSVRGIYDYI
ncbi:biotin--[acetyl-CoA-carboxylase] ligase [Garciella nitratireducens]|uniref:biotin--[acetyl-CoA-carboxylase] ligase n=1 Tax=Garciella nitratireducens TaxID=218205 RepID=UPI000E02B53F|nr:biotin--[acetyl-CoA-carboxylase] ligase [Garciella nitratireducens]RBP38465.1 BirA family biotin operon repressor/biotin-[acetyl-CoA-carboxylase] ligase [Garciella nitratireducens]